MIAKDLFYLTVNHTYNQYAYVSYESESFWVQRSSLEEEFVDDSYDSYQEWVSGALVDDVRYQDSPRIIFDNGGGVTLQLPNFAHHYLLSDQCAIDIKEWLDSKNADYWDGNEDHSLFDPTFRSVQNGGYIVYDIDDFLKLSLKDIEEESWDNIRTLFAELLIVGAIKP